MKPVKKLPTEVCSLVRSGVVIPTPSQAVMELVLNSIDAEATSIAVRVDLRLFKIQVTDNGLGITSEDLEAIGNRSVTSKCYTLDEFYNNLRYHGYRGEALASLREMCGLLEIVTRASDCDNTYNKLFIHGKEEEIKISDLKRPTHGTTVTVTDFMYNMPVRRKQMKEVVELETIRSYIEYIALAHPKLSISIRNDAKGRIILEKHKSSSLLNAFEHLFGHNLARSLAAVNFSTEKFKINGYISKESYRHNDMQFMYVNRQPVMKTKLLKLVSALLSKSSIIRTNGPWKNKPIPKNVPVERWLSFPSLEKNKKFAVFVINITCARKEYEMCWDSKKPLVYFKDWEGILSCISNAIQEFLKIENLVEDDEDCNNEIIEEKTRNYATTSHQDHTCSTHNTVPQETSLKNNQQMDYEVETWNIQGAVHGVSAKRPKERRAKVECKERDNENPKYGDQIRRQFLTPDSVNSSFQNEQESAPPVVKFIEKYGKPAIRLNVTKGAYLLKQMEESKIDINTIQNRDNENPKYGDQIRRQFLTPDSVNSSFQNEQDSAPPVVKFIQKYGTPAIRLNITKGAYRLKQMEEEQRKLKIGEKLDKFKFSSKPKLCRLEKRRDVQNGKTSCNLLLSEKTKDQISLKLRKKGPLKGNTFLRKKVHEQFICSSSSTSSWMNKRDEVAFSESKLRDNVIDMDLAEDKSPVFMDLNSSLDIESHNVPNSLCSSVTNDYPNTDINLEFSGISTATSESDVLSENRNQHFSEETYKKNTRGHLTAFDEEYKTNVQSYKTKSSMMYVDSFGPQVNSEESTNVFHGDARIYVMKRGCWNLHPSDVENNQKTENCIKSFDNKSSKPCGNLEVSEILVVSIPTPQRKSVSITSVNSSEFEDKPTCCKTVSVENQLGLTDYHKNHVCLPEQSVSPLNVFPSHTENSQHNTTNMNNELFMFEPDECTFVESNCDGHSAMKCISSSLVFNSGEKKLSDVRSIFDTPETREANPVPHLLKANAKNKANVVGVADQWNITKPTSNISVNDTAVDSEKVQNFKNIFECFEKNLSCNSMNESKSPYFTIKNSVCGKQALKPCNFKQGENNNNTQGKDEDNSNNNTFVHNNTKVKGSGGLFSLLEAIETNQNEKELFTGFPNTSGIVGNTNDIFNDSFNFSFFPCSLIKNPKTCFTEQMEVKRELTSAENSTMLSGNGTSDIQPPVFHLDQTEDISNNATCISKKRRLSKDIRKEKDPENITSNKKEEFTMRNESFDSGTCMTSAVKNVNVCEEEVTFLKKKELGEKEAGNSPERIMEKDWLQLKNFEGKLFYFHAPSGFTSYNPPSMAKDASLYSITKRFHFLPKGMSPLLAASSTALHGNFVKHSDPSGMSNNASEQIGSSAAKDDLKTVKWRDKPDIFNDDILDVLDITKALSNKKTFPSNTTIPDLSFISAKMSGMLLQQKFDKRIFTNIQVVGQLDNKFIITLCSLDKNSCPHILGIFDQHAVHERIRLEALMMEYSDGDDSFAATDLHKPIPLTVSAKEAHVMSNFQSKFEKLGLHFSVTDKDNIEICRIPTCLYTRFVRERSSEWLEATLHILIQDVVLFLIKTGGQDSVVPEVFKDVINSEACKGAIKFGDPLSAVQCNDLLSMLSKCELPFYCAHGRPSFMPILDLRQFEEERRKYVPGY